MYVNMLIRLDTPTDKEFTPEELRLFEGKLNELCSELQSRDYDIFSRFLINKSAGSKIEYNEMYYPNSKVNQ